MELAIIGPISMALGAILLHMAIDRQRKENPEAALVPLMVFNPIKRLTAPITFAPRPSRELSTADVLLADTLTELLSVKEQLATLESKVDALTNTPSEPQQLELRID